MSTMRIRWPRRERAVPRLAVVAVLPTPPFWLATAMIPAKETPYAFVAAIIGALPGFLHRDSRDKRAQPAVISKWTIVARTKHDRFAALPSRRGRRRAGNGASHPIHGHGRGASFQPTRRHPVLPPNRTFCELWLQALLRYQGWFGPVRLSDNRRDQGSRLDGSVFPTRPIRISS